MLNDVQLHIAAQRSSSCLLSSTLSVRLVFDCDLMIFSVKCDYWGTLERPIGNVASDGVMWK